MTELNNKGSQLAVVNKLAWISMPTIRTTNNGI